MHDWDPVHIILVPKVAKVRHMAKVRHITGNGHFFFLRSVIHSTIVYSIPGPGRIDRPKFLAITNLQRKRGSTAREFVNNPEAKLVR